MENTEKKQPLVQVKNLCKYFEISRKETLKAVDDLTFDIYKGETVSLVGESGCGKSTTGRTMIKLYNPTSGNVYYDGKDIFKYNHAEQKEFCKKVQMIFQNPYSSLNPRMTVKDIVGEGLKQHGMSTKDADAKVEQLLATVGLNKDHMSRSPHEFSGGQRQRIGIARALSVDPEFIICDEPISALDVSIQAQVINMLKELQEERGLTYLFIAHDLSVVKYISDRVVVMYLGTMVETAETDELYAHPMHPYTQALLGAQFSIHMDPSQKIQSIESEAPSPLDVPKGCPFQNRCEHCTDRCKAEMPKLKEIAPGHAVACFYVEEQKI